MVRTAFVIIFSTCQHREYLPRMVGKRVLVDDKLDEGGPINIRYAMAATNGLTINATL